MRNRNMLFVLVVVCIGLTGCSQEPAEPSLIYHSSADDTNDVVGGYLVTVDSTAFAEGHASLRVDVQEPATIPLYEVHDINIENARLIYRALMRSQNIQGQAYLEMWCQFPGKGEYFSRDLTTPVVGTSDWKTEETQFFLRAGQNPNLVKLNLVVNGSGTVWVDDVGLYSGSLN
jgi:hypothetical protein